MCLLWSNMFCPTWPTHQSCSSKSQLGSTVETSHSAWETECEMWMWGLTGWLPKYTHLLSYKRVYYILHFSSLSLSLAKTRVQFRLQLLILANHHYHQLQTWLAKGHVSCCCNIISVSNFLSLESVLAAKTTIGQQTLTDGRTADRLLHVSWPIDLGYTCENLMVWVRV